jgi:S1-C subfamily serine protease
MAGMSAFHETYVRAAGAVAFVAIIDAKGDEGIGSAFHIGDGIFVTARHVIDGVTIKEIATTKSAHLTEEAGGKVAPPRRLEIVDGPYFAPDGFDVAIFRVDLSGTPLPAITVSQHTDYALNENDLVLSDILVIGYPPIPFTTIPTQVVTLGQINAVVRVRHSPALHFIASVMARGGFSGGVALDQSGIALALATESLGQSGMPVETGYMSLLPIESAVDLAAEKFGFGTHPGCLGRYTDTLFAAKFSDPSSRSLSSFIYDASLYVYDDDRDVFVEINCANKALLAEAVATFEAITPLTRHGVDGSVLYTPKENPSAELLIEGGVAVAALFERSGYKKMALERSQWQLWSKR